MLDRIGNFKTSEIELKGHLPEPEQAWLVDRLCEKRCVAAAACDSRELVVEYDADLWCSIDLLDFLEDCGIRFAAVHTPRI